MTYKSALLVDIFLELSVYISFKIFVICVVTLCAVSFFKNLLMTSVGSDWLKYRLV